MPLEPVDPERVPVSHRHARPRPAAEAEAAPVPTPALEEKGRCTGPRSAEGKARASMNARVHGCTSRKLLLPEEDPAAFEALRQDWLGDFQPAAPTALELVEQTAQAHWLYLRVSQQWDAWEARMGLDPVLWKEEDCKMRERLGRYRTTAERSFHRALTAIEARRKSRLAEFAVEARLEQSAQRIEWAAIYRRDQVRLAEERVAVQKAAAEERARENARRAEERAAAAAAKKASASVAAKKKKKNAFPVAEQWLEIRVTEGVTTTEFVPSNEELLEEIAKAVEEGEGEPEMVYRRMNFPDGVPAEYKWTNSHDMAACEKTQKGEWCEGCAPFVYGGAGIQRLTFATWKDVIAREAERGDGHAGPTGVGNLPRPKERGGDMGFAEMLEMLEVLGEGEAK